MTTPHGIPQGGAHVPQGGAHVGYFKLIRREDVSGVSGTGEVAQGVLFPDGRAVLVWVVPGAPSSLAVFGSLAELEAIHGHGGRTVVEWLWRLSPAEAA